MATPHLVPQAPKPSPHEEPVARSPLRTVGWIGVGTGAAALLTGAVTGAVALSKSNELADSCSEKVGCTESDEALQKSAKNLALATDILVPVGAALAVTGTVLLLVGRSEPGAAPQDAAVHLHPVVGTTVAGLCIEGRF